jgi:hypothetical protein
MYSIISLARYQNFVGWFQCKSRQGRYCIFKPTIWNESSHEISNNNGVRVVNFATSKNLVVKSTIFPHCSTHKYAWTSPDGKTHNQIDHILIHRRWHSSILDVRSFRGADCDSDQRLAVSKWPVNKMGMDRFNLKKIIKGEVKEQFQVTIKNRF